MADQEIIIGNSRPYRVDLTINGATFIIPPLTSKVQAAIVSADKTKMLAGPLLVLSTLPGADWTKSQLIVKFPRAMTAGIKVQGKAYLEVKVSLDNAVPSTDDDDWTWFFPVNLVKGNISQ